MQATHAIDRPTPADRQIGHVESLRRVVRILAAKSKHIVERYTEPLVGIPPEILLDKGRSETVKPGSHRRMGGEEITGSRHRQRDFKGLSCLFHEVARTFQNSKRRVSFI